MFRQSSQRNQRNNGFKLKQALKICLSLAVSIWLLYQVWHSWNKSTTRGSTKFSESQNSKFGRKELQGQFRRSEIEEDVKQKVVQDVESKHDEHQVDQERVTKDNETEAHKSDNDEGKETDLKEEEDGENDTSAVKDENEGSTDESSGSEKDKEEGKNETENKEEAEENKDNVGAEIQEKSTEENGITGSGDKKGNGSEEKLKKIYEQSDATNDEDSKKNESEVMQEKSSEENDTMRNVDSKGNGSEEVFENGNENNDATSNGDSEDNRSKETPQKNNGDTDTAEIRYGKENGSEETQDKSNEDKSFTGNGERKANKEDEGESKGSEEERLTNEKLVESKSHGETIIDDKSSEDKKEKEIIIENAGVPESQMLDRIEAKGDGAREKNRNAEEDTSSEKKIPNESETQEDKENSPSGERMMNNEGKEVVDKGKYNTEATGENQNGSGLNMTESVTFAKNDSAILPEGEQNNSSSLLERKDNFNQTTEATQSDEQLTLKGQSADAPGRNSESNSTSDNSENQNTTTENIIPSEDSTHSILEKKGKTEQTSYGESTGSDLSPTTENQNSVNGVSAESLNNSESVVVHGQRANFSASNKREDESQHSTSNKHIDKVPNQKYDTRKTLPQEYHGSSKEDANIILGENHTSVALIPTPTAGKEVSSNSNGIVDAGNHDSVNTFTQDEKKAQTDTDNLPDSAAEENNQKVAGEK